jgi:uncharacterized protein (DUF3820 family)
MTDASTTLFPFGKHKGKTVAAVAAIDPGYLQWVTTTDIPSRYPDLALQIQVALQGGTADAAIPDIETVQLLEEPLPELRATVRGGGRMHDGVTQISRLHRDGFNWRRETMHPTYDQRSASGKSGHYGWTVPSEDGVYEIQSTEGSIAHQRTRSTVWLRQAGQWARIDGDRPAVIAVLRALEQDAAP